MAALVGTGQAFDVLRGIAPVRAGVEDTMRSYSRLVEDIGRVLGSDQSESILDNGSVVYVVEELLCGYSKLVGARSRALLGERAAFSSSGCCGGSRPCGLAGGRGVDSASGCREDQRYGLGACDGACEHHSCGGGECGSRVDGCRDANRVRFGDKLRFGDAEVVELRGGKSFPTLYNGVRRGSTQVADSGDAVVSEERNLEKPQKHGKWYEHNKEKRRKRKAAKALERVRRESASEQGKECSGTPAVESEDDVALKNSLKEKWRAQNELATLKARRDYEAMKSTPIEDHIRSNRVRLQAAMERNMVSIEKTHAKLAATGNVPGDMTGFCATIVGSDSISPSSSASLQELRTCQKKLLDSEVKIEVLTKALVDGGLKVPVVWGPGEFVGGDKEHHLHDIYTDNTENRAIFAECSVLGEEDAEDYGYPGKIKFNPA